MGSKKHRQSKYVKLWLRVHASANLTPSLKIVNYPGEQY